MVSRSKSFLFQRASKIRVTWIPCTNSTNGVARLSRVDQLYIQRRRGSKRACMPHAVSRIQCMPAFACTIQYYTDGRSSRRRAPRSWRCEVHACMDGREEIEVMNRQVSTKQWPTFRSATSSVVLVLITERTRIDPSAHARAHACALRSDVDGLTDHGLMEEPSLLSETRAHVYVPLDGSDDPPGRSTTCCRAPWTG